MSQIFHPSMNTIAKASVFGAVFIVAAVGWAIDTVQRSPYITEAGIVREQPVPFSHEHHVKGLGIDCRYCHTSVEKSSFAGIPPTETCMTCHSQIWKNAPMLQPVRDSWNTSQPLHWIRVHNLQKYVYFNHSVHIAKGIGCNTCHGQVNEMPLMYQNASLQMEWCLTCHRDPAAFIRPDAEIFNMDYHPESMPRAEREKLVADKHIQVGQITNCSVCHR